MADPYGLEGIWILLFMWTDFALEKSIEALIWAMDKASVWILKKKKEIYEAIAKWLDAGYRGLKMLLIIYVAGAVVVGIEAIALLVKKQVSLKAALAALKTLDTIARVKLSLTALKVAWEILTEVDERFADLEKSFFQFAQAFNESFGWPIGFLATFASSYRVYLKSLYAAFGFPDVDARVAWFSKISDALKKADAAFDEYALNPGKFLELVEGLAVIASGDDLAALNRDTLTTLAGLLTTTSKATADIQALYKSMTGIVESFPQEIKEVLDKQLKPITDVWDNTVEDILEKIGDSADEMLVTVKGLISLSVQPVKVQLDAMAPWVSAMLRFLGYELPDPEVKAEYLDRIFTEGILKDNAALTVDAVVFDAVHNMLRPEPELITVRTNPRSPVFIPWNVEPVTPAGDPTWYVGENPAPGRAGAPWYIGG
jgi:hypothetical protein